MYLPVIYSMAPPWSTYEHSKLDYCNSLFLNFDSTQIQRFQLIQNSLARSITRMPRHHCFTPVLKSLHWLKIPERIHFKVLSLTYNSGTPSVHLPLRTFHNSANPLYPILLLSHPFSTPCHFPSDVLQQSHIHSCTTSLE